MKLSKLCFFFDNNQINVNLIYNLEETTYKKLNLLNINDLQEKLKKIHFETKQVISKNGYLEFIGVIDIDYEEFIRKLEKLENVLIPLKASTKLLVLEYDRGKFNFNDGINFCINIETGNNYLQTYSDFEEIEKIYNYLKNNNLIYFEEQFVVGFDYDLFLYDKCPENQEFTSLAILVKIKYQ